LTVRRSPLLPIFLIVFVDILGLTMIIPLLPFYAKSLGASDFVVGLLFSSYAFFQLIAGPVLGKLSDQYGRKPLLILSQVGTLLGFVLLASAHSLFLVFASRIIDGITAGNLSLAQAYISDVTTPEKRTQSFGIIGIAFGIGFTIGPGISGELARFGYVYPILAACALSFTSILCTTFLLPRNPPVPEGIAAIALSQQRRASIFHPSLYVDFFHRPRLGSLLAQFLCFAFSFATFFSGFALFGQARLHYGPVEVGQVLLAIGILGILFQGRALGWLVKRFGEVRLSRAGYLVSGIGGAATSMAYNTPSMIAATGILSIGSGVVRPSLTSLITRSAARDEQGLVLGITQSLQSIAQIIGPMIATGLIGAGMLSMWAWASGGFMLLGLVLSLLSGE
jgi:DHA1 family tetracycline resistance protein-like MFS transporter